MLTVLYTGLALTGCRAPLPPEGPTELRLHVPDYEAFFDASLSVLRRYDFAPDYADRLRGVIVSEPVTSGQWFEPWRVDAPGGYQLLESSLHTVRRVVTVRIEPHEMPAATTEPTVADVLSDEWDREPPVWGVKTYRVSVQVDKARFSAPERQITTASGALAIYSTRIPTTEGVRGPAGRDIDWVPVGRDPLLEAFLLEKLANALPSVSVAD